MKKIIVVISFVVSINFAYADQLSWVTKDQAEQAVEYINDYGIREVILWCACCDGDFAQKVTITKVYYRYSGTEDYYEVVIEGTKANGDFVNESVDLAYVHVKSGTKANCLGKELGFPCKPCTAPFNWTE